MTQPKPLPEIAEKGEVVSTGLGGYYVENIAGWFGPIRRTQRGAILAWNRVMTTHYLLVTLRRNICDRIEEALNFPKGAVDAARRQLDKIRRGE